MKAKGAGDEVTVTVASFRIQSPGECENCSCTALSPFLTVCWGTMNAGSDAPIYAPHLCLVFVVLRYPDAAPTVCKSRLPARLRDLGRGRLLRVSVASLDRASNMCNCRQAVRRGSRKGGCSEFRAAAKISDRGACFQSHWQCVLVSRPTSRLPCLPSGRPSPRIALCVRQRAVARHASCPCDRCRQARPTYPGQHALSCLVCPAHVELEQEIAYGSVREDGSLERLSWEYLRDTFARRVSSLGWSMAASR